MTLSAAHDRADPIAWMELHTDGSDVDPIIADLRRILTAPWIAHGCWEPSGRHGVWTQEDDAVSMSPIHPPASITLCRKGGMVRADIEASGGRIVYDAVHDPAGGDDPDLMLAHLVAVADAVHEALGTLPASGPDGASTHGSEDHHAWMLAAAVLARRTHRRHDGEIVLEARTPWTPSRVIVLGLGIDDPLGGGSRRFDARLPASARVWIETRTAAVSGETIHEIRVTPLQHQPDEPGDSADPDTDPLATLRAVAMAVAAGAMDA